jgi:hypothetical protein
MTDGEHLQFLEDIVKNGARDGVSGQLELSVDGF